MTRIVTASALLNRLRLPADDEPGWTPVMRERPAGERERWWQQIDGATRWLIDGGLLRLRLLVHLDGAACSSREAFAFDTDSTWRGPQVQHGSRPFRLRCPRERSARAAPGRCLTAPPDRGELRRADLLAWDDCAVDGSHIGALHGGDHVGPSPADRGRPGSAHHLIVDRHGTPLAVTLTGGNRTMSPSSCPC